MIKLETKNDYSLLDDNSIIENVRKWMTMYVECSPHSHNRKESIGVILDDYQREMHNRGLKL